MNVGNLAFLCPQNVPQTPKIAISIEFSVENKILLLPQDIVIYL